MLPPRARAFFNLLDEYHPQIVQRSLSGGFLTEDAALLNANARSMFNKTGHHV